MKKQIRPEDYEVRPFFKVIAILLLLFLAYVFVIQSIPLFNATSIQSEVCKSRKGRIFCELGNSIIQVTPPSIQGPLLGVSYIVFATFLAGIAILTIKSIIIKPASPRKAD
ncbi:MAG TPA: hypothetical protein PL131_08975 [Methylotenera sp.]|nr:hypothetical protein [Methylotenera sp.]HPH05993.1 hypothetical protein [Methylotenera sp.]HPN00571.1 hypothetical protein [Methylotenera sp.]